LEAKLDLRQGGIWKKMNNQSKLQRQVYRVFGVGATGKK